MTEPRDALHAAGAITTIASPKTDCVQGCRAEKPIAAICHGPWMLVQTGYVRGRKLTSWPSLRVDIENAGGTWLDQAVVVDDLLVTSRRPADVPYFNKAMIELFSPKT